MRYIVICPVDKGSQVISTTTSTNKITFSKFSLPFYVGEKVDYFKNILGFIFTNNMGMPVIYTPQTGNTVINGDQYGSTCTVNA